MMSLWFIHLPPLSQVIAQHFGLLRILGLFIMMRLLNKEIFIKKPYIPPLTSSQRTQKNNTSKNSACPHHLYIWVFFVCIKNDNLHKAKEAVKPSLNVNIVIDAKNCIKHYFC